MSNNAIQATSHPGIGDNNYYSNKYALTSSQVDLFTKQIANFWESITSAIIMQSPQDYINSLRVWPFDIAALGGTGGQPVVDTNEIKYGWKSFSCGTVSLVLNSINCNKIVGSFTATAPFSGEYEYLNYQTKVQLFLPYYGFVELSPHDVFHKTIEIQYVFNLSTGSASIIIYNPGTDDTVLATYECNVAVSYPLGGPIASQAFVKSAISALGALAGGLTAGVGGASIGASLGGGSTTQTSTRLTTTDTNTVKGINSNNRLATTGKTINERTENYEQEKTVRNVKPATDFGRDLSSAFGGTSNPGTPSSGGLSWFYLPQEPFMVLTYPLISEPSNFEEIYGRPSNKSAYLNELKGSGFVQIADGRFTIGGNATDEERNELIEHLQGGVIL